MSLPTARLFLVYSIYNGPPVTLAFSFIFSFFFSLFLYSSLSLTMFFGPRSCFCLLACWCCFYTVWAFFVWRLVVYILYHGRRHFGASCACAASLASSAHAQHFAPDAIASLPAVPTCFQWRSLFKMADAVAPLLHMYV